jgi:hypothetical protein
MPPHMASVTHLHVCAHAAPHARTTCPHTHVRGTNTACLLAFLGILDFCAFRHLKGHQYPLHLKECKSLWKSPSVNKQTNKQTAQNFLFGCVPLLIVLCVLNFDCRHSCLRENHWFGFFVNHQMFYSPSNGVFGVKLIIKDSQRVLN